MVLSAGKNRKEAPPRGRFITLEGGEGTGKSTQAGRLAARLLAAGHETLTTREPGGSPRAEQLREVILSGALKPLGPVAETLAFAAARADHLDEVIRPALARGWFVVCDRFMDSTRAYQGVSRQVEERLIRQLEEVVVGTDVPDLTVILDIPVDCGLKRARARNGAAGADRFEGEGRKFHEAVRQAFLDIAAAEPDRCAIVDAAMSEDAVEEAIWRLVTARLLAPRPSPSHRRRKARPPHLRVVEPVEGPNDPADPGAAGHSGSPLPPGPPNRAADEPT